MNTYLPTCTLCGRLAVEHMELRHAKVMKCTNQNCRLMFSYPQLDNSELDAAYRKLYYPPSGGAAAAYPNTPEEILRQTLIESHARLGPLAGKRLLDFGCGAGKLCTLAQEHGIRTTGIEADPTARQLAAKTTGMSVYATIEELRAAEPDARFDIITLWDVIEHLREPWRDLQELSGVLQSGGRLLLSTMNAGSLRASIERERWINMVNPTHLYYFTRRSLRSVFERSGFSAIEEWRVSIRYPGHSAIRRTVNRGLWACGIHGQLLFTARPRTLEMAASPKSGRENSK